MISVRDGLTVDVGLLITTHISVIFLDSEGNIGYLRLESTYRLLFLV
jgi:hypothetical protein